MNRHNLTLPFGYSTKTIEGDVIVYNRRRRVFTVSMAFTTYRVTDENCSRVFAGSYAECEQFVNERLK